MSDPLEIAAELIERRYPSLPSGCDRPASPESERRVTAEIRRLAAELCLSDADVEALAQREEL